MRLIDADKLADDIIYKAKVPENLQAWLTGVIQDKIASAPEVKIVHEEDIKLRNCVNCAHYTVCATVQNRRVAKVDNYSPCEHWERRT